MSYALVNIIIQWDSFRYSLHSECEQPIHYWLIIALVGIIFYRLYFLWYNRDEEEDEESEIMRINIFRPGFKVYTYIIVGVLYPISIIWTLLGTVWYILNTNSLSKCFTQEDTMNWYFLTWIITFYVGIVLWTTILSYAAIVSYRNYQFERQYTHLLDQYEEEERPQMNFNMNGLSPSQIINIPIENVNESDGMCPICIESFKELQKGRVLRCGHKYHLLCIDKWLMQHTSCPLCKAEI